MNQNEQRIFLIKELMKEQARCSEIKIPSDETEQKRLLRSLLNVRMPAPASKEFLAVQDEYLQAEIAAKGITDAKDLVPVRGNICLWKGDITTLKCGAAVNAANSAMLGCFYPCHGCIDNAIHTFAGVQLREVCGEIMRKQGHEEETGRAKLTPAFNLPCEYILHTVGPVVEGRLSERHEKQLESCYRSCLELAADNGIESIAFCCISTGEFHFPNRRAAEIAVGTADEFLNKSQCGMRVIFNVFKDLDCKIYRQILKAD